MTWKSNWFYRHKDEVVRYGVLLLVFIIGLVLSPFIRNCIRSLQEEDTEELVYATDMVIGDGKYSGTILKNTNIRSGYGRYETTGGSIYEGNWKEDHLLFGTRTTPFSIYTGHFDSDLNNDGFGIIKYTDKYIRGKKDEGLEDDEITATYIGNWSQNVKQGIGRSIKLDGSMECGVYSEGLLQDAPEANYSIGRNVYGIDVSHHQKDIDWNNLAIFCDRNGNVSGKTSEKTYLQPVFFAYIKATEGATFKDEMYDIRMIEAERHGVVKGAYHFLHLGSPIEEQLKNFFETVTWNSGDLPPALDVEVEDEIKEYGVDVLQSMTLKWLQEVEKKMGSRPVIYTRERIRENYLSDSRFKDYHFWIARYSDKGPEKCDWLFWQKTEKGLINGHDGYVDINLFQGNYATFKKTFRIE